MGVRKFEKMTGKTAWNKLLSAIQAKLGPKSWSKIECLKSLVGGLQYEGVGKIVVSVLDCKSHIQPVKSNDQDEF